MVSSSQIRDRLHLLLSGRINLDSFEDWLVQNTWNIHVSGSVAAESLTFAIEESLSEYSSRHISEQELHHELAEILGSENRVVSISYVPRVIYSPSPSVPLVLAAPLAL